MLPARWDSLGSGNYDSADSALIDMFIAGISGPAEGYRIVKGSHESNKRMGQPFSGIEKRERVFRVDERIFRSARDKQDGVPRSRGSRREAI